MREDESESEEDDADPNSVMDPSGEDQCWLLVLLTLGACARGLL